MKRNEKFGKDDRAIGEGGRRPWTMRVAKGKRETKICTLIIYNT